MSRNEPAAGPAAPPNILLSGVVGSVAYGLDHEGSDVDRLGMFAAPTERWHGLNPPTVNDLTWNSEVKPDVTMHEALKVATLCLACNPTVTELLWLPDGLYEIRTPLGGELIGLRRSFLSAGKVRDSYLRYIQRQFRRLETRGDGSFSADKRIAKHARHLYRLHAQGIMLWQTGHLTVRLPHGDAVLCRAFGEKVAAGDLEAGRKVIAWAEHVFDTSPTPLPGQPDEAAVENWLQEVRRAHYGTKETSCA